jgi:FlaA1/EpsC-like NDP-sugar epimerase
MRTSFAKGVSVKHMLDGAAVLVTGGTGSLGQAFIRRVLRGERGTPTKVIAFSRDEAKHHAMKTTWKHLHAATDDIYYSNFEELIQFWIGDVRDYEMVRRAVAESDIVIHAAAMKQVPTCEYFPAQAVATNIIGAENVVRAARATPRVQTVVAISTDKACKPINVMGMTKAIQERIVVEGNLHQDHCRMAAVRYGNVLSSRGSVIPLFLDQIAHGGPVTITLPQMTRFLLSLDRAVDTIFEALESAHGGDVIVPKIDSARVEDIALALIGDREIEIIRIGIRPGEKIHEILVSEEEAFRTVERNGYYVVQPLLPEFRSGDTLQPLSGEYSSADAVLTGEGLTRLLAESHFVDAATRAVRLRVPDRNRAG